MKFIWKRGEMVHYNYKNLNFSKSMFIFLWKRKSEKEKAHSIWVPFYKLVKMKQDLSHYIFQ